MAEDGTFTLKVDTANEAFGFDATPELVRILRLVADRLEAGLDYGHFQTILDMNGNDVGRFAWKPRDYFTHGEGGY